jgi:tRNA synthetase class II core domain (G, H, P, S and T)
VGYSTCFRKEAGAYGRDNWGIFRVHQFEKIEQFCITSPEGDESEKMHKIMIENCKDFYKSLGLCFRVVSVVSGELNNAAAKKYDLEAWSRPIPFSFCFSSPFFSHAFHSFSFRFRFFSVIPCLVFLRLVSLRFPTLGVYRELVSASNCTDYQSRALQIRFGRRGSKPIKTQNSDVKKESGVREKKFVHMLNATLCATERTICCLLENFQTAAGVRIPEVLQPYMFGLKRMKFIQPSSSISFPPSLSTSFSSSSSSSSSTAFSATLSSAVSPALEHKILKNVTNEQARMKDGEPTSTLQNRDGKEDDSMRELLFRDDVFEDGEMSSWSQRALRAVATLLSLQNSTVKAGASPLAASPFAAAPAASAPAAPAAAAVAPAAPAAAAAVAPAAPAAAPVRSALFQLN